MKKIVVVEDEEAIRENIIELLELNDYEVVGAPNGYMGVQKIIQEQPDLILCDIMMPELDGYEVLKTIRSNSSTAHVPFIFLTAKGSTHDFREGMELGADDYIPKPYAKDELLAAVETRINRIDQVKQDIQSKITNIKRNISSVYSHEFNTPLNGIIGFTELLLEYYQGTMSEEMLDMVNAIKVSSKRLHRVTDNLVLFADLQRYDMQNEHPEEYKTGATENYKERLQEAIGQIAQVYQREKDLHIALTDGKLKISLKDLRKIITEATDNAFKYSDRGQQVRIESTTGNGFIEFRVSDQGKGMKTDTLSEMESFANLEKARKLKYGMGLGFYIIHELARLNHSEIHLESAMGKGTTFTLKVPTYEGPLVGY